MAACASAGVKHSHQQFVDLPGVGQNLQDHPLAVAVHQSPLRICPAPPISNERGWVILYARNLDTTQLQLHCSGVSPAFARRSGLPFNLYYHHPESRGSHETACYSPATPLVQVSYLQKESDIQLMVEGLKFQSNAFGCANEFQGQRIAPGPECLATIGYIPGDVRILWHPVGTY